MGGNGPLLQLPDRAASKGGGPDTFVRRLRWMRPCGLHLPRMPPVDSTAPPPPQVDRVCDELLGMEELKDGYVAVGFSQARRARASGAA